MIQDGQHLLNCLRYVSLNMVRAGVVRHPGEWKWCSHDELTGRRFRYRILAIESLLQRLEMGSFSELKRVYEEGIERVLKRCCPGREPEWTESPAVGDKCFIEAASRHFSARRTLTYAELTGTNQGWTIRESASPYNADSAMKSASKAKKTGGQQS